MKLFFLKIDKENVGYRLDKILTEKIKEQLDENKYYSRNRIKNMIKNNFLKKNGFEFNNINYKVKENDNFEIILDDIKETDIKATNIAINIVYEDNDVIVINKQAGLSTHPGIGNYDNTLVNALLFHRKDQLSGIGGFLRPGIVHRIDKNTSGLIIVAKNDLAHNELCKQIRERSLKRIYNAFVWGQIFPTNGSVEGYIKRSKFNIAKMSMTNDVVNGKFSLTYYKTIKNFNNIATLIECSLDTGRTHQIRVHMSSKKFPLIGDSVYGGNLRKIKGEKNRLTDFIENFPRQALHAKKISFFQPTTKEQLTFEIDIPDDLKQLQKHLTNILLLL